MDQQPIKSPEVPQGHKGGTLRRTIFALLVAIPAMVFWLLVSLVLVGVGALALLPETDNECTVARIPLHGVLTTTDGGAGALLEYGGIISADTVVQRIHDAENDDSIRAIMLDVDSPGGTPVAGDEIMQALTEAKKPTVAVVRDLGASAAYWAIAGADHLIASPVSDVGSIGVTMSYTELAGENKENGSRWIGIASGSFKDAGNPERPLTEDERTYFQTQVNTVHDYMIDRISAARTALSRDELALLADGKAYIGKEAKVLKLIDELGGFTEARAYLAGVLGESFDSVTLCDPVGGALTDLLF